MHLKIHLSANDQFIFTRLVSGIRSGDFSKLEIGPTLNEEVVIFFAGTDDQDLDQIERLGEACLKHVAQHRQVAAPPLEFAPEHAVPAGRSYYEYLQTQ